MMLQDRGGRGLDVLMEAAATMVNAANQEKATTSVFTFFENSTPRLHLKLDREKVERLNVPYANVVEALEVYLGSVFINEFNYLGRTFRVIAQADSEYRHTEDDILRIKVKSNNGDMVPIGSVAQIENTVAPHVCLVSICIPLLICRVMLLPDTVLMKRWRPWKNWLRTIFQTGLVMSGQK